METTSLYYKYCQYSYEELQELFKSAECKEEQDFYMALANLLLRAKHQKVVERTTI